MKDKSKKNFPHSLKIFARENRVHATDAEQLMWRLLRNNRLGVKFRRQHPISLFILDFYCHEQKLAIELDGGQHYSQKGQSTDKERTVMLKALGITILRFSNRSILLETEGVLERVWNTVFSLSSSLNPFPHP